MKATRLSDEPILHAGSCNRIGDNLNGASLIWVPAWLPDRLGAWYLYFAHHTGRFIRMAYADTIAGPWRVYRPGVLDVLQTPFAHADVVLPAAANGEEIHAAHIASPDVHVDDEARRIRMYCHGLDADGGQTTRLALSDDGLRFSSLSPSLGPPYFRVFRHQGWFYAIAWGGELLRARDWQGPFESGPDLLRARPLVAEGCTLRHAAVVLHGGELRVFYTCIGDTPERIWQARVELTPDWTGWRVHPPAPLLRPELPWEGVDLPVRTSLVGAADGREHAVRDPFVLGDILLYSGAGESAIGVASLDWGGR